MGTFPISYIHKTESLLGRLELQFNVTWNDQYHTIKRASFRWSQTFFFVCSETNTPNDPALKTCQISSGLLLTISILCSHVDCVVMDRLLISCIATRWRWSSILQHDCVVTCRQEMQFKLTFPDALVNLLHLII